MLTKQEESLNGCDAVKELPVIIPPRKCHIPEKSNGTQHHIDHVANLQDVLQKLSPLQQIARSLQSLEVESNVLTLNKFAASVDNVYLHDKEWNQFDNISQEGKNSTHRRSSTITPIGYSQLPSNNLRGGKLSKSHGCLSDRSLKKTVNICTAITTGNQNTIKTTDYLDDLESVQMSVFTVNDDYLGRYNTKKTIQESNYLNITGTIQRGLKKGKCVDLQMNISTDELEKINAMAMNLEMKRKQNLCCQCHLTAGLHILMLSLLCWPIVTCISSVYCFYIGTLTWYNVFNYINEEKSLLVRFIMSPILVLTYPFIILICTICLGCYAGLIQISLQYSSWRNEVADIEKGFYSWLCGILNLSECSPYEIVIFTNIHENSANPIEMTNYNKELAL